MKTLIVAAHPRSDSLCQALADAYAEGAQAAGSEVRTLRLAELNFDALADPRVVKADPASDLLGSRRLLTWADHVVIVFPTWWGTYPALLSAWFAHVLTPGFAYNYRPSGLPEKLLRGRSARLITTMGSPRWWNRLVYRDCGLVALRTATLGFCGIGPIKTTVFDKARTSPQAVTGAYVRRARELGRGDARGRTTRAAKPSPAA
jgi:1,4-dihydroxy-2-naphthoate octaprenyltransferase